MSLKSTLSKLFAAIFGIAIILIIIDIIFFQSLNTSNLIQAIQVTLSVNPVLSWGIVIFLVSIILFIGLVIFYRRRIFVSNLKTELENAERITLVELAQHLDETPARIEVELNRMASSRVSRFQGLLIISQGKHVFLGDKLLTKITESYNDDQPRGEIANSLEVSRDELDKAIDYLISENKIKEREEKTVRKVRPSYRRGTR
ncbi:MAG: hypothetical protein ACXACF_09375 [Candidatus Hermodarchaeia archaeon]|jgi:hypothetical protein